MKKVSSKLKRVIKEQKEPRGRIITLAIVTANNHYAGFGPETSNIFRKMVGLPSLNWQEVKMKYDKLVQTCKLQFPKSKNHFLIICRYIMLLLSLEKQRMIEQPAASAYHS
jgi:hypothetical protein